jgi:chlorite dismutase
MSDRLLSFFYFFQFSPSYWALVGDKRREIQAGLLDGLSGLQMQYDLYQIFPLQAEVDMLLWCTIHLSEETTPEHFFSSAARLLNPFRHVVLPRLAWWGMTRPSDYARGKSEQEIDPFDGQRSPYLVVYPFSKTAEWYKLSRDARQGMMNEHIRIGHQYSQIKQLLLYSTGLQDQEFIVTYETGDLGQFSALVTELRSSEARRFTANDTPVFTAVHRDARENLALFG